MCGRFTLRTPTETIADLFAGVEFPEMTANFNIAPTQSVAAIRQPALRDSKELSWLRWGLVPSWATDIKMGARMINARCETIQEKPAFRAAFKKRRCLILADGFYEWQATPTGKQPIYIYRKDEQPFGMAGLWECNSQIGPTPMETCTVITTAANPLVAPIHDRMPVILPAEHFEQWLDSAFEDATVLQSLLQPYAAEKMSTRAVSRNVNKVGYNQADCLTPTATQGELF